MDSFEVSIRKIRRESMLAGFFLGVGLMSLLNAIIMYKTFG